jgi:UDP:flavonoid glycosyltransferase YjiC (YdhE family)
MTRPRVMLAWELGANLGHLYRLSRIAAVLRAQGAEPVWVVPPHAMRAVTQLVDEYSERVLPAPTWARPGVPGPAGASAAGRLRPRSFAGVLLNLGIGDAAAVSAALARWRDTAAGLDIAGVVLDYAPVAMLAAVAFGWNAVQLSNGFDAPPTSGDAFDAAMRGPWLDRAIEQERERVSSSLLGACGAVSGAKPVEWPTLISAVPKWLDCLPETDPFGAHRRSASSHRYLGPVGIAPGALDDPQWPTNAGDRPKAFAYLRSSPVASALLRSIAEAGVVVLCANPDGGLAELVNGTARMLRVVSRPVDIAAALAASDTVIGYGSSGFTAQALLAGKQQLLVPADLEKQMVARRVAALGAGAMITASKEVQAAIEWALRGDGRSSASAVSLRYRGTDWSGRLEHAVSALIQA